MHLPESDDKKLLNPQPLTRHFTLFPDDDSSLAPSSIKDSNHKLKIQDETSGATVIRRHKSVGGPYQIHMRQEPTERGTVCCQTNFSDVMQEGSRFHRKAKSYLSYVMPFDKSNNQNSSSRLSAILR